jgi:Skp family chaperone for outer membrane proteins
MKYSHLFITVLVVALSAVAASAQSEAGPIKSSPAFAEVLLRKTELTADLDAMTEQYTEQNPKMIDLRFELASLDKSLEKIYGVKPSETGKLTLALGKLIVKKAELETSLNRLTRSYNKDHPEVKRAKRRVEIFENSINEILK